MSREAARIHITMSASAFLVSMTVAQIETQRIAGHRLTGAIAEVESGNRNSAVGDGGKALGALQIHWSVIEDVNRRHGLDYYHTDALDRAKAERIFWRYMEIYATEKRLGRPVTDEDRALIWHLGPFGFARIDQSPYREKAERYLAKLRPLLPNK